MTVSAVSLEIFEFSCHSLLSSRLRFIRLLSKSLNLIDCQGTKRVNFQNRKGKVEIDILFRLNGDIWDI